MEVGLVAIVSEWDVPDMLYWMSHVIACLDISGLLGCVKFSKPILVRRHVIGCSRVDEPYVLWLRGASEGMCYHRLCFVPHHEHSAMVSVVGIRGVVHGHSTTIVVVGFRSVICELSAS